MSTPDLFRGAMSAAAAAVALVLAAPAAAADPAPVRGLIVRLKDAPANVALAAAPGASARERAQSVAAADHERGRWQRVIAESGLGGASGRVAPTMRPVGRDQQLLSFEQPMSTVEAQALMARLAARPDVAWVEPNVRERRLQAVPNDPFFGVGGQWWLLPATGSDLNVMSDRRRGAPGFQNAWLRAGTGAPTAVVAVLDTGITSHPDLSGHVLAGYDFVSDVKFANDGSGRDADPSDPGDFVSSADLADAHYSGCVVENSTWHGTVIAGIVAAATDNATGVAGINWNGRVVPVRVAGKCGADVVDIVDGMRWAGGLAVTGAPANLNPARVINISFGGSSACGSAYQTAVNELKAAGVVVVAAAGNEHGAPTRPASCAGVVGVVALNRDGFKTNYSNFGNVLTGSGLATVGGDDASDPAARWNALADPGILTVVNHGAQAPGVPGYAYQWGTSFSAPVVSGTVSLMLSVNPSLTYAQIVDGLRRSARPHVTSPRIAACSDANPGRCLCTTSTCGAGILDAEQAVLFATNPAAYVAPALSAAIIDNADVAAAAALGPDRAANVVVDPPTSSGGGGGGAMSAGWLLGLAAAAIALSADRRRRLPGR